MKRLRLETSPLSRGAEKVQEIFGFSGLHDGMYQDGMLLDCDNVQVLPGGAIASLLAEKKIDVTANTLPPIAGVYTYYGKYDPDYEIPTTAEWVYANVCPERVLQYGKGMTAASRLLIADVGRPAKTKDGYRKVLSAFSDGDNTYVLYDAVYNLIDQRRSDEFSAVGSGYTVSFDSRTSEETGTYTKVYTLTQIYLDVIDRHGNVQTELFDAALEEHKTLSATYGRSLLVSTDGKTYHYVTEAYQPDIGAGYAIQPDKVYRDIYPTLATEYPVYEYSPLRVERLVHYCNRESGADLYGSLGEKLLILPDMRLLTFDGTSHKLEEKSGAIPRMDAAVQHFERLFGIHGDCVYASVAGDCTDYTVAVDNLPANGGWQMCTADPGGFTAIASFDGKAILFTASNMMTVRGVDLPFSLSFEGAHGCIGQDALAVCGEWLYFISSDAIRRYNGSRVETISHALPQNICFADATLTAMGGLVLVRLAEFDGLYVFHPASGAWSRMASDKTVCSLISGSPQSVIVRENGGYMPYALFAKDGDFSFSIATKPSGRRRIRSIALTARLSLSAVLTLLDTDGNRLGYIDNLHGDTVTRTFLLRGGYADGGILHFSGSGGMTLYGARITYAPLRSAVRKLR